MIRGPLAAIAFLTRLPVGRRYVFDAKEVARAARWFPLVGALLGGIYAGALWLSTPFLPPLVTATLVIALDACLTGAMHFDGVADTADGFGGGTTRDDVLRIMRDHAIGSYGATALVLATALKLTTIAALIDAHRALIAVALAPALGRWAAVLLSATQPYARADDGGKPGSAGAPSRFMGRTELLIATVTALAFAAALARWLGLAACAAVALAAVGWARYCRRRIGGVTGDTLGTAIVISECLVLLLFTAAR